MNQNHCHHTKAQIDNFAAINKQQRQEVYSHITSCEECADYKEVADSTADLLGSLNIRLQQPANSTFSALNDTANKMMPHIHERVKRGRRLTWLALLVMASSALALVWFYSQGIVARKIGAYRPYVTV
ncbi:MAG: hypothetical protein ACI8WB_001928 [Phenylobacterium sp.]|jgi:hypothetical protein